MFFNVELLNWLDVLNTAIYAEIAIVVHNYSLWLIEILLLQSILLLN